MKAILFIALVCFVAGSAYAQTICKAPKSVSSFCGDGPKMMCNPPVDTTKSDYATILSKNAVTEGKNKYEAESTADAKIVSLCVKMA